MLSQFVPITDYWVTGCPVRVNPTRLSLRSATDVRRGLAARIRAERRARRWSRATLAERSGVPAPTLKRFETEAEISLRQFAMLLSALGRLDELDALTEAPARAPRSIDDVAPP